MAGMLLYDLSEDQEDQLRMGWFAQVGGCGAGLPTGYGRPAPGAPPSLRQLAWLPFCEQDGTMLCLPLPADACLAERYGLLQARSSRAALICLH